jgi:hypothetical protein
MEKTHSLISSAVFFGFAQFMPIPSATARISAMPGLLPFP